jgi:tungstate transport system ATP-binding protein
MGKEALSASNIIKQYNHSFMLNVPYFESIYGGVYGFYGPNGSGKTTFMKILALIMKPDSGKVFINKREITQSDIKVKRRISFLFQEVKLLNRTVKDNLIYPLKIRRVNSDLSKIKEILDLLYLPTDYILFKGPDELSGGEKKRVSLAQKLIFCPDIIFLDEPTANIDVESIKIISNVIKSLKSEDKCVIISSHDYEWLSNICDEINFINNGMINKKKLKSNNFNNFKYK